MNSHHPSINAVRFEDWDASSSEFFDYHFDRTFLGEPGLFSFLVCFDLKRIKASGRFLGLRGRVRFFVDGCEADQDFYTVPEMRVYLKTLTEKWGYFFYVDSLANGFLPGLVLSLAHTVDVQKSDNNPDTFKVHGELGAACDQLKNGFDEACKFDSGMTISDHDARLVAVQMFLRSRLLKT